MPKTKAPQIHALTSEYVDVDDFKVGTLQVWEGDDTHHQKRVVLHVAGLYQTTSSSVTESDGIPVTVTNTNGNSAVDLTFALPVDVARRMGELLGEMVREC